MKIESGKIVTLGYELFDSEGVLLESSEKEPVEFKQGNESAWAAGESEMSPGIERAVEGREEGAVFELALDPADAFGDYNPDEIVSVPRGDLPSDLEFQKDDWITVTVQSEEKEEEEEGELEVRVVETGEEEVILDANHPLAGQRVTFKIEVLSVRDEN